MAPFLLNDFCYLLTMFFHVFQNNNKFELIKHGGLPCIKIISRTFYLFLYNRTFNDHNDHNIESRTVSFSSDMAICKRVSLEFQAVERLQNVEIIN